MSSWLDRLARRVASVPASRLPAPSGTPADAPSRRTFLKKAAVVTGAAWTVPVMQTALAPAHAVSGGLGQECVTQPCAAGLFCSPVTGTCGGPGAVCGAGCYNSTCASNGYCGGTDATCSDDSQCGSAVGNACNKGFCKKYP